jgi:hypothetical protein
MPGPSEAKLNRLIHDIIEQLKRCTRSLPEKDARAFLRHTIELGLNPPVEAAAIRSHRIQAGDDGTLRIVYDPDAPEYKPDARKEVRKRWSASQIFILFCMFSDKRPTSSPHESPFWLMTQRLNEAVGGDPEADVTRACQAVLRSNKEELRQRWGSRTLSTD